MIRVGKTTNIKDREEAYNHSNINGEFVYAKRCYNHDILEKVCHHMLDKYRVYPEQEWFQVNDKIGIQVVNIAHLLMDKIIPYVDLLETNDIFNKLTEVFNPIKIPDINQVAATFENIYEKISNEIDNKKKNEVVKTQEITVNKPLDFESFVKDACEIGEYTCLKVDIYGAHKMWSRNQEKATKDSLFKYFSSNYESGTKYYEEHNAKLAVFKGIKPKDFVFEPSNPTNPTEIDRFVIDRCKVGYTYRTSHSTLYEEFENFKQEFTSEYIIDSETKNRIRDYFNSKFFPTVVYLNEGQAESSKLSNNAHGVWGITMKNDDTNVGIKISHALKKQVVQISCETKKIVKTWDSLTSAAKSFNLSPSSISTDIRFKRVRNNCVLQYVEKKT